MAKFCTKCGAQLDDAAQFCSKCGTAQTAQQNTQQTYQQQTYQQQAYTPPKGSSIFSEAMKQAEFTAQYHPQDIKDNKLMAILSYIGIFALIPFLAEKNSPYVRFHCVQGMYLFLCEIAVSIVSTVITLAFGFIPVIGWIFSLLFGLVFGLVGIAVLALAILGIVNAATDKAKNLPVIYMLRDRLGWFK